MLQIGGTLRQAAVTGGRAFATATSWTKRLSGGLRRMANTILGALVGPLALAAGALFILNGGAQAERPSTGELLLWGVMALLTLGMLWFADVTAWSLHPLYKWRLARTFAVHRVVDENGRRKAEPVPYKQLLHMSELTPEQFPGHQPGSPTFPELLVCASVNLSDQGTTPPGQSSLSFVFGPRDDRLAQHGRRAQADVVVALAAVPRADRAGHRDARPAHDADHRLRGRRRRAPPARHHDLGRGGHVRRGRGPVHGQDDPGAAAVPAGPDQRAARRVAAQPDPSCRPRPVPANPRQVRLLYEVAGRHRARSTFLYVTDGGHIENLGLLELLRRECTTIVCLDAAGGSTETFSTLGQAIALAASELNVRIVIDPAQDLEPFGDRTNRADHTVGVITYASGKVGRLIYGKALVTADSPWDVRAYAAKDRRFPATPTSDQLFSGETFDAYQALGRHVGKQCADVVTGAAAPRRGRRPAGVADIRENVAPRRPSAADLADGAPGAVRMSASGDVPRRGRSSSEGSVRATFSATAPPPPPAPRRPARTSSRR